MFKQRRSGLSRPVRCGGLALAVSAIALLAGAAPAGAVASLDNPPPGANDFTCRPTAAHPNPVVLVHGLSATMGANWTYLSPRLAQRGYCVYALTYGIDPRNAAFGGPGGTIPIEQSAQEFDAFVNRVLGSTGAAKIDLVGHSEGTYMPQYWLKFLGGAAKADHYVAWTPLYAGTTVYAADRFRDLAAQFGLAQPIVDSVASVCGSCPQFVTGSPMQRMLSEGGAGAPGVTYTTVMTRLDELVTPWQSGYMNAPRATNNVLQELCPGDISEHAAVAVDPVAAQIAFNALDPANAQAINCNAIPPYRGSPATSAPGRSHTRVGLLGARACRSRRRFTIPLRQPASVNGRVLRADVYLNGHRVQSAVGANLRSITLKRLPRGRLRITVVTRTSRDIRITSSRTYSACGRHRARHDAKRRQR